MAIRSHSDITEFFKNEVTRIKAEIDRLEKGIVFFTESQGKSKTAEKTKPADLTPSATGKKPRKPRQKKSLEISEAYNSSLTWDSKVIFVLNALGSGFTQDLVDSIKSHEPDIDSVKAGYIIPQRVSALAGKGHIKIKRKVGRRREYTL